MTKKVSLKEFKEQLLDLIYEVMEEELENLTKPSSKDKNEDEIVDEVPYDKYVEKNFKTTSAGDEIFRDTTDPEMYSHKPKTPMPRIAIGDNDRVYTQKRRS
jgi:hypothetical protein